MKKIRGYRVLPALLLLSVTLNTYAIEVKVALTSSDGTPIENAHVKYFDNNWKNFGLTDENGEAVKNLPADVYDFRMIHNGITVDKSDVDIQVENELFFQTVNLQVHFKNSQAAGLQGGVVSYLGEGWTSLGETDENGDVFVEILPGVTTVRMGWEGQTEEMTDICIDPLNPYLEFQTVKMVVKLMSSSDEGIGGGYVEFKSPGWREFGTTSGSSGGGHSSPSGGGGCGTGGGTNRELLAGDYSFRMTYEGRTITVNNISTSESPYVFQTVKMRVKLKDSEGEGLEGGIVEFNSSGWKDFGITQNPGGGSGGSGGGGGGGCGGDEGGHDPGCPGSTGGSGGSGGGCGGGSGGSGGSGGGCGGSGGSGGSGGGCGGSGGSGGGCGGSGGSGGGCGGGGGAGGNGGGPGGVTHKELLPGSYVFRMTWEGASATVANVDIEEENPLLFHTVNTTVKLVDPDGIGIAGGVVTFYGDEWREAGTTGETGELVLELLPKDYLFNMQYAGLTLVKGNAVAAPGAVVEFEWDGEMLKSSLAETKEIGDLRLYPNPATTEITISFGIGEAGRLDVSIIDMSGRLMETIYSGEAAAGNHELKWNPKRSGDDRVRNGVYLCRIRSGNTLRVETFILAK